jgi:hypothetical protein
MSDGISQVDPAPQTDPQVRPPIYPQSDPEIPHEEFAAIQGVPNFLHTFVFFLIALVALLAVQSSLYALAVSRHLFDGESAKQLQREPLLIVPSEAIAYVLSIAAAALIFGLWWRRPFSDGIQWNARTALRRAGALLPFGLMLGLLLEWISSYLPVPKQLPVDQFFRTPVEVWLATIFGVFIAPAFEEIAFRGFLLPSLERFSGRAIAIVVTSMLFAALHASQLAKAWVPLVVVFCVSVVLCAVRIRFKSVAASALVHAAYNGSIFLLVFIGTDGYRHLDKLKS